MKFLLRVLIIVTFILLSLLGSAQAQQTTSTATAPYLSEIFPISQLNNLKWSPAVAYSPQHHEYLVVWQNQWSGSQDIYGQRVSEHGELLSWFCITTGTNDRIEPAVAYDPTRERYLVVWMYDYYDDALDYDIYGRFVAWDGSSMTDEITISNASFTEYYPQLAYGLAQDVFTVTWQSHTTSSPYYIMSRQISAADGTFPASAFPISQGYEHRYNPDITYNLARNEWLIVWSQLVDSKALNYDIYGVRLSGNGTPLGTGNFPIATGSTDETQPAVAACDQLDQYLVVYQIRYYYPPPYDFDIAMRYIAGDGVPGNTWWWILPFSEQLSPDIVCNSSGNSYLIAWQSDFAVTGDDGIYTMGADANGPTQQNTITIAPGTGGEGRFTPAIGGGQSQFLVTWVHDISRTKTYYQDIYGLIYTPYVTFLPFLKN
jgi:hypothetical protein